MSHPIDAWTDIVQPEVQAYLSHLGKESDPLVSKMEAYATERSFPLIGTEAGRWLELLTRMIGGRRVFEFGSGWGFSAFFFARAVGAEGQVIGSERDAWELKAHESLWAGHSLASRVDLRLGDAMDVFAQTEGLFDVVFMDIHKQGYLSAMEAALPRLRPGGLLLADNVLWGGKTARPAEAEDASTQALQQFNARLFSHPELQSAILPACDGLAVALKRS